MRQFKLVNKGWKSCHSSNWNEEHNGIMTYTRAVGPNWSDHMISQSSYLSREQRHRVARLADARFATDIMAEHAFFFARYRLCRRTCGEGARRSASLLRNFRHFASAIDSAAPPDRNEIKRFANDVVEQIKPFIEYKARLAMPNAAKTAQPRWPLFFDHTQHEPNVDASSRDISGWRSEFDKAEVTKFWTISWTNTRASLHSLEPDEYELIEQR